MGKEDPMAIQKPESQLGVNQLAPEQIKKTLHSGRGLEIVAGYAHLGQKVAPTRRSFIDTKKAFIDQITRGHAEYFKFGKITTIDQKCRVEKVNKVFIILDSGGRHSRSGDAVGVANYGMGRK
jgi:hypothetical protein